MPQKKLFFKKKEKKKKKNGKTELEPKSKSAWWRKKVEKNQELIRPRGRVTKSLYFCQNKLDCFALGRYFQSSPIFPIKPNRRIPLA
jgi:hypothetical protein